VVRRLLLMLPTHWQGSDGHLTRMATARRKILDLSRAYDGLAEERARADVGPALKVCRGDSEITTEDYNDTQRGYSTALSLIVAFE